MTVPLCVMGSVLWESARVSTCLAPVNTHRDISHLQMRTELSQSKEEVGERERRGKKQLERNASCSMIAMETSCVVDCSGRHAVVDTDNNTTPAVRSIATVSLPKNTKAQSTTSSSSA